MVTVTPHQHALPIIGANAPNPAHAAQVPTPKNYRPIHVSNFDRRGRDLYAAPT